MFVITESEPPSMAIGATGSLLLSVEILAAPSAARYQIPRLKVDTVEIDIQFAGFSESSGETGKRCAFTLSRLADKTLIEEGEEFLLEVGEKSVRTDPFVYRTIADVQKLIGMSFDVKGDSFSFSTLATNKFSLAPLENLVIYDPERAEFGVDEIEVISDDQGNSYGTESLSISDLTLYDIFQEIFVERLGFDSYETDIEDYPVRRADFPFSEPFMNGIKPIIGAFEPVITERDGVAVITDTTKVIPADFPAPRDLSETRCEGWRATSDISLADIVRVSFSATDGYDYRTPRSSIKTTDNGGSVLDDSLITTVTTKVFYDYFYYSQPNVVQKTDLGQELIQIFNGTDVLSNRSSEESTVYHYDSFGRLLDTVKTVKKMVPDPDNEGEFIWKTDAGIEYTTLAYTQHPFNIRSNYLKTMTRRESEPHVIDTENPYAWNREPDQFNQSLSEAQRAGNMPSGFTYSALAPTKTFTETFTPHRNGQVFQQKTGHDHVQGTPIFNRTDPRTGEVSLNGQFSQTRQMYVLEDGTTKGTGTILDLAVGEIPSNIFQPLAKRVLKKRRTLNKQVSLSRIGYDPSIRRGTIFSISDKEMDVQGVFICLGYSVRVALTEGADWRTDIDAIQIGGAVETAPVVLDFNSGLSFPVSLYSSANVVLPISVESHAGYELSSETVAGLTVEGRESGVGSYTNLETGAIDLTPFAGTTQEFDIKLTAASTSVDLKRIFRLLLQ